MEMGSPVAGSTKLGTAPLAPPPTKLTHAAGGIGGSMSAAFEPPGLVAWLIVGGVAIAAGAGGAQRRAACRSRRRRPQWAEALALRRASATASATRVRFVTPGGERIFRRLEKAARGRASASQNEAEESDATEEEATRESTTRGGRPRGGMKVAARVGERLRREIGRGGRPRVGDGWRITPLSLKSLCGGGVPSSHPSLGLSVFFLFSKLL